MVSSKFKAEVKEREAGEPCFVLINTDGPIGLGSKQIAFDLPAGTQIEDAHNLAKSLRGLTVSIR